jgi:hypothetical protein
LVSYNFGSKNGNACHEISSIYFLLEICFNFSGAVKNDFSDAGLFLYDHLNDRDHHLLQLERLNGLGEFLLTV